MEPLNLPLGLARHCACCVHHWGGSSSRKPACRLSMPVPWSSATLKVGGDLLCHHYLLLVMLQPHQLRVLHHPGELWQVTSAMMQNIYYKMMVNFLNLYYSIYWMKLNVIFLFSVTPKIIYASRTHSQLSQAVAELKRTSYNYLKVLYCLTYLLDLRPVTFLFIYEFDCNLL